MVCETAKANMVMVVGEVTAKTELDYEKVVRGFVTRIGFGISDAVLDACLKEDPMSRGKVQRSLTDSLTWATPSGAIADHDCRGANEWHPDFVVGGWGGCRS